MNRLARLPGLLCLLLVSALSHPCLSPLKV